MNEIKIFSPATVANISCGFDVLGFCLDTVAGENIFISFILKVVIIMLLILLFSYKNTLILIFIQ